MRYPLHWPQGWPRSTHRVRSRFGKTTVSRATTEVLGELDRLRVSHIVISTNLVTRLDGLPRSGQRTPDDPGVAVYFRLNGCDRVLACDQWDRIEHNMRAIAKHVEALRGIDRWGVGSVDKAFDGYSALPPPPEPDWRAVLCLNGSEVTSEQIKWQFRTLLLERHPDHGGDAKDFAELQAARDAALAALGGSA